MLESRKIGGYYFSVFKIHDPLPSWHAVYVVLRGDHVIYVGQTEDEDVRQRMFNHEKWPCFQKYNADTICLYREYDSSKRRMVENDLINQFDPPCNDPFLPL